MTVGWRLLVLNLYWKFVFILQIPSSTCSRRFSADGVGAANKQWSGPDRSAVRAQAANLRCRSDGVCIQDRPTRRYCLFILKNWELKTDDMIYLPSKRLTCKLFIFTLFQRSWTVLYVVVDCECLVYVRMYAFFMHVRNAWTPVRREKLFKFHSFCSC